VRLGPAGHRVGQPESILLGDCDIAIGGGAENMSRGPYANLTQRWGSRMGDAKMVDMMVGALHDPVPHHPHGRDR
jgi:acetyl-CoA C-acetyltransferase